MAKAPEPSGSDGAGLTSLGLLPFALSNLGRPKLVRGVSLAVAGWQLGKMAWKTWEKMTSKPTPAIIIYSNQQLFDYAMLWLSQQQIIRESRSSRSFFVSDQGRDSGCHPISPCGRSGGEARKPVTLTPADNVAFEWRGCRITCSHERKSMESDFSKNTNYPDKLMLGVEGADEAVLVALVDEINRVGRELSITKPDPWVYFYRWDWQRIRRCSHRGAILPDGQLEAIIDRIRGFRENREWYASVGMPHRLGFLLHGKPGSGKTSTVLAVAAALEMDVYWLNPANLSDDELMQATARVGDNDILLIEDCDCVNSAQDREKKDPSAAPQKGNSTLAGLLNVIDGAVTRDGRVLFMTTNHRNALDPALIRPGRIDVQVEFTNATFGQIKELATRFGHNGSAEGMARDWSSENICMAEVQERLIRLHAGKEA